ncbi:hypothetical protein CASFOL_021215 [Castilleja foliolosa]|uniref:CCHC-type domain-containing protein n=1 Tax=Castilleja foliolosa TaxID=1961234 RepID=A0ABD3CVY2_9LAMI
MNAFKTTITKAWNIPGNVTTNLLQENTMVFVFNEKDKAKVLNSTWTFRDHQVLIVEWPEEKALHEIEMTKIRFWIHVFGIPAAWIDQEMAENVGNFAGKFVKADLGTLGHKWRKSLRIQIDVDILKPLTTLMLIGHNGRKKILLEIRYERLTDVCYKCGKIGHKSINCPDNMEGSDESNPNPKYGPWMKAENSHIQNPKYQVHIPTSEREVVAAEEGTIVSATHVTTVDGGDKSRAAENESKSKAAGTAREIATVSSDKMEICQQIPLETMTNGCDEGMEMIKADEADLAEKDVPREATCAIVSTNPPHDKTVQEKLSGPIDKIGPAIIQPNNNANNGHGIKRKEMEQGKMELDPRSNPTLAMKDKYLESGLRSLLPENKSPTLNPNIHLSKKLKIEPPIFPEKQEIVRGNDDYGDQYDDWDGSKVDRLKADEKSRHIYAINRENIDRPKLQKIDGTARSYNKSTERSNKINGPEGSGNFIPPLGSAGGLILAWKDVVVLSTNVLHQSHFHCFITYPPLTTWKFTAAYVPCNYVKKAQFWDSMADLDNNDNLPWLIMGDFNAIVSQDEKLGGLPFTSSSYHHLSNDLNNLGLIDLGYVGYPYTWDNKRVGVNNIKQRLDVTPQSHIE